jgi:hypothetical protein
METSPDSYNNPTLPSPFFIKELFELLDDLMLHLTLLYCKYPKGIKTYPKFEPILLFFHINMKKA